MEGCTGIPGRTPMEGSTGKTGHPWRVGSMKLGRGPGKRDDDPIIPPESPLGRMLRSWDRLCIHPEVTMKMMVKYCYFVWPEYKLARGLIWPPYGTNKVHLCRILWRYLEENWKGWIERECGLIWVRQTTREIYVLRKKGEEEKEEEEEGGEDWDVFQHLPPSCPPELPADPGPAAGSLYPQLPEQRDQENVIPTAPPENNDGVGGGEQHVVSPPRTRIGIQFRTSEAPQETEVHQMPLRQVPLGGQGGGFGFATVPLTTQDIRGLKKRITPIFG